MDPFDTEIQNDLYDMVNVGGRIDWEAIKQEALRRLNNDEEVAALALSKLKADLIAAGDL